MMVRCRTTGTYIALRRNTKSTFWRRHRYLVVWSRVPCVKRLPMESFRDYNNRRNRDALIFDTKGEKHETRDDWHYNVGGAVQCWSSCGRRWQGGIRQTCAGCHTAIPTAPKLGDKAAWAPLIKRGSKDLIASVIKGKSPMPPKGGAASDADAAAATEYMINAAK